MNIISQLIFFLFCGYGAKETFLTGLTNISAFLGLGLLYFIKPFLTAEKNFSKVAIISVIISSILLFLCIINQLMLFGAVFGSDVIADMVLSSRILNFGNFFARTDALFTFIWIFSELSYLSFSVFIILHIFKKISYTNDQNGMLYAIIMIILGACILPQNFSFLENTLIPFANALTIILLFIVAPLILIFANIKIH